MPRITALCIALAVAAAALTPALVRPALARGHSVFYTRRPQSIRHRRSTSVVSQHRSGRDLTYRPVPADARSPYSKHQ